MRTLVRRPTRILERTLKWSILLINVNARTVAWFLVQLYRSFPSILQVLAIIRPGTLVRPVRDNGAVQYDFVRREAVAS